MKKRFHSLLAVSFATIFAMTSFTACGSSSKSSSQAITAAETVAATMANPAAARGMLDYNYMDEPQSFDTGGNTEENIQEAKNGSLTSSTAIQPISSNRKLIRTVDLYAETTEFDRLISNITQSVSDAGGYIEQSDISGTSISDSYGRRYAYLTARVPSESLDQFITLVGDQANITNKSESTQDVTLRYSDIESRKKSLTIEQERLWELLEKADTLEAVIALEQRLSEIRYQLESFESQLRTYDNQVDYSTVHININEVKVLTPTAPDSIATRIQKGFRRNMTGIANSFVNFIVWLISSLPILVTLAVILAVIIFICRLASAVGTKLRLPKLPQRKKAESAPADKFSPENKAPDTHQSSESDKSNHKNE